MAISMAQKAKEDLTAGDFWSLKVVRFWFPVLVVTVTLTTIASVRNTYEGFTNVALLAPGGLFYLLANALIATILVALLRLVVVKPTTSLSTHLLYALAVGLGFQTLVHADLKLADPLVTAEEGTEGPLPREQRLSFLYENLVEEPATKGMDQRVLEEKEEDITSLQRSYPGEEGVSELSGRFRADVRRSGLSSERKQEVLREADGIVANADASPALKVELFAELTYKTFGRGRVERYIELGK